MTFVQDVSTNIIFLLYSFSSQVQKLKYILKKVVYLWDPAFITAASLQLYSLVFSRNQTKFIWLFQVKSTFFEILKSTSFEILKTGLYTGTKKYRKHFPNLIFRYCIIHQIKNSYILRSNNWLIVYLQQW